jgi:P-type conjugative transfer protein TrbG
VNGTHFLAIACGVAVLLAGASPARPSPSTLPTFVTHAGPVPTASPLRVVEKAPAQTVGQASAAPMAKAVAPPILTRGPSHHRRKPIPNAARHVAAANRASTRELGGQGLGEALVVYPFVEGSLYHVYTAPGQVTDIALQPGEALGAVAAGDTVRWVIGDTASGAGTTKRSHVLIKPFASDLATNLVITTDRHVYHLSLTSTARTAMTALSWVYPQDQLIALQKASEAAAAAAPIASGLAIEQLHFNYMITGDKPDWRPLRAFDDGRQTFIEFRPDLATGIAPPLFVVGPNGAAELVNYRVRGHFYVVDRLFDAAELRFGLKRQQIVRITRTSADQRWAS